MDPRWRHPHGLRPTIRHLMIVVAHVAVVSAFAASLLRGTPSLSAYLAASVLPPLSPPLLALLVLILDRPGPAKSWLVGLIAHLTIPAFLVWAIGIMAVAKMTGRIVPGSLFAVPIGLGAVSLIRVARRRPGRCPECGVRAFLPVGRLRWCAACGLMRRPRA